jgi:hypothetical protein
MAMEDHGKRFSMVVKTFHHKTIYPSEDNYLLGG